jgi:hypothetical protein
MKLIFLFFVLISTFNIREYEQGTLRRVKSTSNDFSFISPLARSYDGRIIHCLISPKTARDIEELVEVFDKISPLDVPLKDSGPVLITNIEPYQRFGIGHKNGYTIFYLDRNGRYNIVYSKDFEKMWFRHLYAIGEVMLKLAFKSDVNPDLLTKFNQKLNSEIGKSIFPPRQSPQVGYIRFWGESNYDLADRSIDVKIVFPAFFFDSGLWEELFAQFQKAIPPELEEFFLGIAIHPSWEESIKGKDKS